MFVKGVIKGGDWPSTVPTECDFQVRIGFFPGKKLEDVRKEVEDTLEEAAKAKNIPFTIDWQGFQAEGCEMNCNSDMMKLLGKTHKDVVQQEPVYQPVTCTTDARIYELYYGIPCTCYGPEATNIHR